MNLAEMLADTKLYEQQLIRTMVSRKGIMNRNYINKSELNISENEIEKKKFETDRENNINKLDTVIFDLKERILANKEIIDEKNVEYGIDIFLQKVKWLKIELQHLTPDKYSITTLDYDCSERIRDLEITKVKILNKIMTKNHTINID